MRILGLDVGEKRIGVARVDSDTKIALPVGFIENDASVWQQITRLSTVHNTLLFVIGLPRSNEGNETAQSKYVRDFAKVLTEKIPGAKIRFQDESLTSVEAKERLKVRNKIYNKGDIDAEAAVIILQDFIESYSEKDPKKLPNYTNLIEKEAKKIKLNTKKAKHKMKNTTKWLTGIIILVILGVGAAGGALLIKDIRAKERAAEYARQEAEMQAEVFSFTIRPGETIFEIKQSLLELGYDLADIEAAFNAEYDFNFLKSRPTGATLEGYLFGETHEFYKDTTVSEIITTFLKGTDQIIKKNNLETLYAAHGLTLFEGITLASIVQKEANAEDQPTVAQVFLLRLNERMHLGSDVTVSYALDVIDPNRSTYSDNQTALVADSCYNTRLHSGLPCGPISNPGLSALLAVANPTDTAYLYFLTGDDGLMYYSYTENEHNQKAAEHCQELCSISL